MTKIRESAIWTVLMFLYLYAFQGLTFGISKLMTLKLRAAGVSYTELAVFALTALPMSTKILFSAFIDSTYFEKLGRRKTWVLIAQLGLAGVFVVFYFFFGIWLEDKNVLAIAIMLFILFFWVACQDIAVDGWVITKFSQENKGLIGPIQSLGIQFGVLVGFSVFVKLEKHFPEFVTLDRFFAFIAIILIVSTALIIAFAGENTGDDNKVAEYIPTTSETYQQIFMICMIKPVWILAGCVMLFTIGKSCVSHGGLWILKMTDRGLTQNDIANAEIILMPCVMITTSLMIPFLRKKPLYIFFVTGATTTLVNIGAGVSVYYYYALEEAGILWGVYFSLAMVEHISVSMFYVVNGSFFAMIADPSIGGTYMSFLWTVANLCGKFSEAFVLWFAGKLDPNDYHGKPAAIPCPGENFTQEIHGIKKPEPGFDPFHMTLLVPIISTILWYIIYSKKVIWLQNLHFSEWRVNFQRVSNILHKWGEKISDMGSKNEIKDVKLEYKNSFKLLPESDD